MTQLPRQSCGRVTPNGTTIVAETFLIDGVRVCREQTSGGPFEPMETVWLRTLDGRRVVGWWIRGVTGAIAHYRDRGDDVLGAIGLAELIAAARERWPGYALAGMTRGQSNG